MKIRIAGIVSDSIVDGPGLRFALFVQGCPHHCPGCHNPHTHDPLGGFETTTDVLLSEIRSNPLLDGVTFSGGEPFLQAAALAEIAREVKKLGLDVIVYTGYVWEDIVKANREDWNALLSIVDVVVDGPFIQKLRNWELQYRGSSNQRTIDVKRSLAEGRVIEIGTFKHMPACA